LSLTVDEYPDTSQPEAAMGIAAATRSPALFALRSFYEYLCSEDLIANNPTATIKVPGARKLRTEICTDTEADLMLAWVGDQPGKPRPGGLRRLGHLALDGAAAQTRLPCSASTRWTSPPGASRSSARATRPASCSSLPRLCPSSTTI
jgi:hypothetical protein